LGSRFLFLKEYLQSDFDFNGVTVSEEVTKRQKQFTEDSKKWKTQFGP
jgi:hypothetical protein